MSPSKKKQKSSKQTSFALYHCVWPEEGFDDSVKHVLELIKYCAKEMPDSARLLVLDIDDHRNVNGGFDADMYEFQSHFLLRVMLPYLQEIHMPLFSVKNPQKQTNKVPDNILIMPGLLDGGIAEINTLSKESQTKEVYVADFGKWMKLIDIPSMPESSDVSHAQTVSTNSVRSKLRMRIYEILSSERVSINDLEDISFRAQIDWEELTGITKSARSRSLIEYADRRQKLMGLKMAIISARSDLKDLLS